MIGVQLVIWRIRLVAASWERQTQGWTCNSTPGEDRSASEVHRSSWLKQEPSDAYYYCWCTRSNEKALKQWKEAARGGGWVYRWVHHVADHEQKLDLLRSSEDHQLRVDQHSWWVFWRGRGRGGRTGSCAQREGTTSRCEEKGVKVPVET